MRAGRLILFLLAAAAGLWLYRSSSSSLIQGKEDSKSAPIDRAKAAAEKSQARNAEAAAAQGQADGGSVTENMTPDQVRALLGPPDEIEAGTTDNGRSRETWTYRRVG
ncbi:MAG TPA: hypothetical protein VN971_01665, partial [Thermoanaerobaculia bacterium]|nr:hypothetical protein [Thermoanaerobaculia bacterium]